MDFFLSQLRTLTSSFHRVTIIESETIDASETSRDASFGARQHFRPFFFLSFFHRGYIWPRFIRKHQTNSRSPSGYSFDHEVLKTNPVTAVLVLIWLSCPWTILIALISLHTYDHTVSSIQAPPDHIYTYTPHERTNLAYGVRPSFFHFFFHHPSPPISRVPFLSSIKH